MEVSITKLFGIGIGCFFLGWVVLFLIVHIYNNKLKRKEEEKHKKQANEECCLDNHAALEMLDKKTDYLNKCIQNFIRLRERLLQTKEIVRYCQETHDWKGKFWVCKTCHERMKRLSNIIREERSANDW